MPDAGATSQRVGRSYQQGHSHRECRCGARRIDAQLGLEATPADFIATMVAVFREVKRVLREDGTLWLNLGSSYASGGKRTNQSRGGVPAYDNGDIEPEGSPALDSVCSDLDDELLGGSLSHRDRIADTDQRTEQEREPYDEIGQNTLMSPCSGEPTPLRDALVSTSLSSSANGQAAFCLADTASAVLSVAPTSQPAIPQFGRSLVFPSSPRASSVASQDQQTSKPDTAEIDGSSASRTSGKGAGSASCDCGSCGICFAYSAMKCLRFKAKDLMEIPHLVAMALQADGWYLRSSIVWSKPNPMPESCRDRPTSAHEHVFLLSKRSRYFYDADAVREEGAGRVDLGTMTIGARLDSGGPWQRDAGTKSEANGRNLRNVWEIATHPYSAAHFATFPPALAERCIRAGSRPGDTVLDPFSGAGTTALVADRLGRNAIGIDLSHQYVEMSRERLERDCPLFASVSPPPATYDAEDAAMRDLFREAAD